MKFRSWGHSAGALLAAGLLLIAGGCADRTEAAPAPPPAPASEACSSALDRAVLEQSLTLGTKFLMAHQRPEGNFDYEYDWLARTYASGDSQVRQAGVTWGLALTHHARPDPIVAAALARALDFFDRHSVVSARGTRFIRYPGDPEGATGTIALVALSLIEQLRAGHLPEGAARESRRRLDGYVAFLADARTEDGRWHGSYDVADGTPSGRPSSYFDGEALLALVKAARYLGYDDLRSVVLDAAEAGYRQNVTEALAADPDSAITKGYYQWSSMAYFELATWDLPGGAIWGERLLELADWMIDVHRTLERTRNTGYAYEGIVHAHEWAARSGQAERAAKYACVIGRGLERLTGWQIGSPLANTFVRRAPAADPLALGGVQNHASQAPLRIDVTQHQMHAVLLALRYIYAPHEPAVLASPKPV